MDIEWGVLCAEDLPHKPFKTVALVGLPKLPRDRDPQLRLRRLLDA